MHEGSTISSGFRRAGACRFRHSTAQWPHLDRLEPRLCLSALFTLAPGSPISVGYIPNLAAVGDFDGGGNPDLAVTHFDGGLSVLLGNGEGGLTPAHRRLPNHSAPSPLSISQPAAGLIWRSSPPALWRSPIRSACSSVTGTEHSAPAPGPPITVGDSGAGCGGGRPSRKRPGRPGCGKLHVRQPPRACRQWKRHVHGRAAYPPRLWPGVPLHSETSTAMGSLILPSPA